MQIGFNGASSMKTDLIGDIKAASRAGYDLVEIWAKKMDAYLADHSIKDLKELFRKANVKPLAINSVEFITFNSSWEKINTLNAIKRFADIADKIDCPYIVLVPSPRPAGIIVDEVRRESVKVLREVSNTFKSHKVRFAFEFLGFEWCSVSTLEMDFEIVKAVNRDNIGLVLDTFHFHAGGSTLESIRKVDKDKIYILHINDAEDLPRESLQDAQRLFPGEGVIPLKEIAAELKGIGYEGPVSLEMFRPEYWKLPAVQIARKGMQSIRKFF